MSVRGTVHFGNGDELDFDVDFMSFVSDKTFGKPAIIAPGTDGYSPGQVKVLYVNTALVPAVEGEKYE